jgi:hypothetical protein
VSDRPTHPRGTPDQAPLGFAEPLEERTIEYDADAWRTSQTTLNARCVNATARSLSAGRWREESGYSYLPTLQAEGHLFSYHCRP